MVIDRAIKNASFLPLVSEIKFTTISPVKDPIGKQDWMNVLAHSRSQYRPIDVVIVKSSAIKLYKKTYLACTYQSPYMRQSPSLYHHLDQSSGTMATCTERVSSGRRTSWRPRRWPEGPATVFGTCVHCLLTTGLIWVWLLTYWGYVIWRIPKVVKIFIWGGYTIKLNDYMFLSTSLKKI